MMTEEEMLDDGSKERLAALATTWSKALEFRGKGEADKAEKLFRSVLQEEPRLAEPRLELAHMHAGREEWAEAQAQAQLAIETLRAGGQWLDNVEPEVLLAFALNLLGELIVRPLEEGDLLLEDKEAFLKQWNRASTLFQEAHRLDPDNFEAGTNLRRYSPIPSVNALEGERN